jgi:hypothetical protein
MIRKFENMASIYQNNFYLQTAEDKVCTVCASHFN